MEEDAVPEWVDIPVIHATDRNTILSLVCCGRFTKDESLLYYREGGVSPFGIKSPPFPPRWDENSGKYDLNSTATSIPGN